MRVARQCQATPACQLENLPRTHLSSGTPRPVVGYSECLAECLCELANPHACAAWPVGAKRRATFCQAPHEPLSEIAGASLGVDGRSPGLRLGTPDQPSRKSSSGNRGRAFTDYSCGGSPGLRACGPVPGSHLISLRRTINVPKSSGTDSRESSAKALYIVF